MHPRSRRDFVSSKSSFLRRAYSVELISLLVSVGMIVQVNGATPCESVANIYREKGDTEILNACINALEDTRFSVSGADTRYGATSYAARVKNGDKQSR